MLEYIDIIIALRRQLHQESSLPTSNQYWCYACGNYAKICVIVAKFGNAIIKRNYNVQKFAFQQSECRSVFFFISTKPYLRYDTKTYFSYIAQSQINDLT